MIDGVTGPQPGSPVGAAGASTPDVGASQREGRSERSASFEQLLAGMERSQLRFSGHAMKRIEQRGLHMDSERLSRLEQAVDRAASKGARESVVLLDELALVVSVRNQTVVTALDEASRKEHVFTNIDSVVIAD